MTERGSDEKERGAARDSFEDQLHDVLAPSTAPGSGSAFEQPDEVGPFEIVEQLGRGGMGTVYRGTHRETGVDVAVKVIHEATSGENRERFHQEVQAHAGLVHPGIVYLFEYGEIGATTSTAAESDGQPARPYVAMELAGRGTLRRAMPLESWSELRRLLVQMLDALAYAHARGVVHRDLKPENLLLFEGSGTSSPERVKLADFGIAHAFGEEATRDTEALRSPMGTPLYMAPEQFDGDWRQYGPWTDLYALGCIVWECVCGRPPFVGEDLNFVELSLLHRDGERPELEPKFPIPEGLEGWIRRCMDPSPEQRFRRAADALWNLPSAGASPEEAAEGRGRAPADVDPKGETRIPTFEATAVLDTNEPIERAETVADPEAPAASRDRSDASPASARDAMAVDAMGVERPPVPETWRRRETESLPAPLVGTGLGLFGLREPPFVDRETERTRLWESLRRVTSKGSFEGLVIQGEAGTGKSRLAEWIATRAHEVGAARVVRAVHTEAGGANEGLRGGLERALRGMKLGRGELFEHLKQALPRLERSRTPRERDARALTEYLRPTDDDADRVEGPRYRFSSFEQKRALIVRVLERLARRRPVLLWLDDLQWGSEALGVLEELAAGAGDEARIGVLATVRSDVAVDDRRFRERLESLMEKPPVHRVALEALSREHQRALLEGLLPLEGELVETLAERTEGHPLFAMQLLGHWIEQGAIRAGAKGFRAPKRAEVELPDDVHELWSERIESLAGEYAPSSRSDVFEALEVAGALGREVDEAEWRGVLGRAGIQPPDRLVDRLVERGLAERTADGWAFAHGLLVETLERRARREGRWRGHHRACVQQLEGIDPFQTPGVRERIAGHWVEAGEPVRALDPLLEAIHFRRERGEEEESIRLLERREELLEVVDVSNDAPSRLEQQIEVARRTASDRDVRRAKSLLSDVWSRAGGEHKILGRTARFLAEVETALGEIETAREWGERALEHSERASDARLQCQTDLRMAWICLEGHELDTAEKHASRAVERAGEIGDVYSRLEGLEVFGWILIAQGDEGAREHFERVRRESERAGFVVRIGDASNALGDLARYDGRYDDARERYREFLEIGVELSRPLSVATAHSNLAQVALRTGDLEGAIEHFQASEERFGAIGAEEWHRDMNHLIRLGYAAGTSDRSEFDELWEPLREEDWPEGWGLVKDHPWLLETAAEHAHESGWHREAREVASLAADLWRRLGNEEAARDLEM